MIGHDAAKSVYDESILKQRGTSPGPMSFFFAGIGDARHLFATFLHIAAVEKNRTSGAVQN